MIENGTSKIADEKVYSYYTAESLRRITVDCWIDG